MELEPLVHAAARGDERAWRLMSQFLKSKLRPWFGSRYPGLDSHDLTQDTLIVIYEKLPDFEMRSEGEFMAWVFRIAQLSALVALRQWNRKEKLTEALEHVNPTPSTRMSSLLYRAKRLEQVLHEVDKLPESYRRAVENVLSGGDAKDLARLAGIKWGSARGVESRAWSRLRELLRPSTPS